ncbi:arsenic transporter [Argonema galeatum]|uniref:arsenic transporter n=1 Tax=Argonema galeatum TaxID=2942762 RepID=UPI0020110483|nr:arsenic transporter [Argonema galeatum]MCL1464975.1 arsenic transporter [Argonema galeatum A003/A1]
MVLLTIPADISAAPIAIAIFLLTLTLVIWQPRGLGIGFSALGGALLALATGVVTLKDIPEVWQIVWNATFTLVALIIISLILDEAGFFRWLALHVARWGRGRGKLLFPLVILLGAVVTALFTNDGTALILNPIVIEMLLVLGFGSQTTLAFVMATGFIADTTSLPLTVSNLVNIISADYFHISFGEYALVMVPVNFVAVAASLGVLWFYFHRSIPVSYSINDLALPGSVIRDHLVFRCSFIVLGLLLCGYFLAEPLGVPVSLIAGLGALGLLALAGRWFHPQTKAVIPIGQILRSAPWQVVVFSLGMYLVVTGLRNAGLTAILSHSLEQLSQRGFSVAALGMGFLATLLSAVMNNLPTVLINAIAIEDAAGIHPHIQQAMVYANAIGCDIGAKITPTGSLSTLLWLHVLDRKGIRIRWSQYLRISFILTLPVLFITLLSLVLWLTRLLA